MDSRKQSDEPKVHPTKLALRQAVIEILDTLQPEQVSVEMVCEKSGISPGSLYHHYENLPNLIDIALVARFSKFSENYVKALMDSLDNSDSAQEFFEKLTQLRKSKKIQGTRRDRIERAGAIFRSESSPNLRKLLGREQQRQIDAMTIWAKGVQDKGWGNKNVDPQAAAVFIQAYLLGQVIDDISESPIGDEKWQTIVGQMVATFFMAK